MKAFFSFLFLIFFVCPSFSAQELSPVKNFSSTDYGAENQNWGITQSDDNFMYVANNKGLLEYNGAEWQLYSTPNNTIMRSIKAVHDRIFTGFYMDFGFWKKDEFGVLKYTSIAKNNNIKLLEDEQIWEIVEHDGWVLFRSLERIYLHHLSTKASKIIESSNRILKLTKVGGILYYHESNKGVFKIENGVSKLISDAEILKKSVLINMFVKEGKLFFLTKDKGFYYLENDEIKFWNIPANKKILDGKLYSAIRLKNNDFILGSISNGIYHINSNGELNYQVSYQNGLSNNTILSIFEDADSNVWLGLDAGISYLNVKSPFKIYNDKNNSLGTIYISILHQENLYLGTNHGVFFKKYNSKDAFQLVPNTQGQVWNFKIIDDSLFCGHDSGTFIINGAVSKHISTINGAWDFKKVNKNLIIQGNYSGLYVLEKKNSQWKLRNKIEGFDNSSRYFEFLDAQTIFVNHEYKGVFKLKLDKNFRKINKVAKEKSVEIGTTTGLIKYEENIYYSSEKGVFRYFNNLQKFEKDTVFSKLISKENFSSAKLIYNKSSHMLWAFSKDDIRYLTPGLLSDLPIVKTVSIAEAARKGASGFENIIHLNNKKYLIGGSNGYLTLDLSFLNDLQKFNVVLNKVENYVQEDGEEVKGQKITENKSFNHLQNNFEFHFSVPKYNKINEIKFQYQLEGQSERWSVPSKTNKVLFKSIEAGEYAFKVRGILEGKLSVDEAVYQFTITKPWYLSSIAIGLYIFGFLSLFYALHVTSKRYYKNQREELLEKAQKESELKAFESNEKIMKLKNEKLKNDVSSKNRELASSTMNIIKKNEFLNAIKTALIKSGKDGIDKVIKIIDQNLNNTDDWTMFQEAFNNVDKKFLKKIKKAHPNLTPNDLRLCAYLRLNLSSKEIAPLLNISPRSVEVKRYRLRKRMELPRDANLTSYILEI